MPDIFFDRKWSFIPSQYQASCGWGPNKEYTFSIVCFGHVIMFPLCVPPKSIWCCHSCHIKHNDKIMHTDEERGALSAICLTHQKYIVYLPHQSNQFILHLDSFGLEEASVRGCQFFARYGNSRLPEFTRVHLHWKRLGWGSQKEEWQACT